MLFSGDLPNPETDLESLISVFCIGKKCHFESPIMEGNANLVRGGENKHEILHSFSHPSS